MKVVSRWKKCQSWDQMIQNWRDCVVDGEKPGVDFRDEGKRNGRNGASKRSHIFDTWCSNTAIN